MEKPIIKFLWIKVLLLPLLFWFFNIQFLITDYDDNIAYLSWAVLISLITAIVLFTLRYSDSKSYKKRKVIRLYANLLGTPVAFVFGWIYITYFQMQFVYRDYHVRKGQSYTYWKRQNYFKAENTLVNNDLSSTADTTIAVIRRNGEIENIWKVEKGDSLQIKLNQINYLSDKQKKDLLKY